LLVDGHLANEVAKAEKTLGIEFSLWQRLP
jgi:hypothetical protein